MPSSYWQQEWFQDEARVDSAVQALQKKLPPGSVPEKSSWFSRCTPLELQGGRVSVVERTMLGADLLVTISMQWSSRNCRWRGKVKRVRTCSKRIGRSPFDLVPVLMHWALPFTSDLYRFFVSCSLGHRLFNVEILPYSPCKNVSQPSCPHYNWCYPGGLDVEVGTNNHDKFRMVEHERRIVIHHGQNSHGLNIWYVLFIHSYQLW